MQGRIFHFEITLHPSPLLVLAAVMGLTAVRILDLSVYHRMLRGAVSFNECFEEEYMKKVWGDLDKFLTQSISHFSRYEDASYAKENGRYKYEGKERVTAEMKLRRFYNVTTSLLVVITLLLLLFTTEVRDLDLYAHASA